jgi:putative transposase
VTRVLERLIEEHGRPGRPMQNGHVESFDGRLRDECLNTSWFRTFDHVRSALEAWRTEYNQERPHSALDYRTPWEFRRTLETATINPTENLQL